MNEHEAGFVGFVARRQRRRITALMEAGDRGRPKLRLLLAHAIELDERHAVRCPPRDQTPEGLERLLAGLGAAADCYVLSESPDLDGRTMPLRAALDAVVGRGFGAFVSCAPGRLGYFEAEGPGERYLLKQ